MTKKIPHTTIPEEKLTKNPGSEYIKLSQAAKLVGKTKRTLKAKIDDNLVDWVAKPTKQNPAGYQIYIHLPQLLDIYPAKNKELLTFLGDTSILKKNIFVVSVSEEPNIVCDAPHIQKKCLCEISLNIETQTPIILSSYTPSHIDPPILKDKNGFPYIPAASIKGCVRDAYGLSSEKIVIPGSTLRSALRNQLEQICNSIISDFTEIPHTDKDNVENSSEDKSTAQLQGKKHYWHLPNMRKASPFSKLFGTSQTCGSISVTDAFSIEKKLELRTDNLISHSQTETKHIQSQAVSEILVEGLFSTQILLTNFELWMLGAISYLLWDLQDGMVYIGSGRTRGLGQIKAQVSKVKLIYYQDPTNELKDFSDFLSKEEKKELGLYYFRGKRKKLKHGELRGIRHVYDVTTEVIKEENHKKTLKKNGLFDQLTPVFKKYLHSLMDE